MAVWVAEVRAPAEMAQEVAELRATAAAALDMEVVGGWALGKGLVVEMVGR